MANKFKSVLSEFAKVKTTLIEEKDKKDAYNNPLMFKPVMVKGEERTKFRLRFLPMSESKIGKPWLELKYHMFERDGDNRYVKIIDPRNFNRDAKNPIAEYATKLWNSDNAMDKESAKKYFTKQRYFTLVYVKEAPENQKDYVGKVLIFEVGKQIFDILDVAIKDYDNCFWDPFSGQDFLLIIKNKGGEKNWPDYTQSNFLGKSCPISEDEKEMDRIATELETVTIKSAIIDKEGIKSAAEMEEILWAGIKKVATNENEGANLAESSSVAPSKPKINSAQHVDFGDQHTSASVPAESKAKETKVEQKVETKAPTKPAEVETKTESNDEFNVDLGDIDLKF